MLNRKTVMALAAAMVMAVLYGCSGSDNSGLKNDLEMYKEKAAALEIERDARITPEAEMALRDALGEMELTPEILVMLVARADITADAYQALMDALPPGAELTEMTLAELAGRAELTQAEYADLMAELGMMPLNVATLRGLVGRADITADAYQALMDALPGMELTELTLRDLAGRAAITAAEYQALMDAMALGMMDLTTANIAMLLGRADITATMYEALMNEMPQGMDLSVQNLRMLAERADITAAAYMALMDALGDMELDVATLEMLVARADITQAQYDALMVILPTLNDGTSLQNAVTMANQYTALLAALGATDMTHAEAVALAMDLVAEDARDPVDDNRVARKIAGLVMADTVVTDADIDLDLAGLLMDRFGAGVIGTETDRTRKATIIDPDSGLPAAAGLSVGMLTTPSLQLIVATDEVDVHIPGIRPDGFEGALFNEGLAGGRNLMTYAYTDVMDPWEEMFETAYGRLAAPVEPEGPPPVVEAPGTEIGVDQDDIDAYTAYLTAKATYDLALANYQRDLATIAQGDFMGHPVAGGPSNTPDAMQVVDTAAEENQVGTVAHFWSLSRIDTKHYPVPPPRADDSAIVITDPLPVDAQYREEGHDDGTSMLSGTFDGVPGNFICETEQAEGLCTIGAVRTDKEDGGTVVGGVEYIFDDDDTWKFIADDRAALVATKRQDGDYLVMGWWLETADASTGDFKFGRFFAGSDPYGDTGTVVVPGETNDSARYTGAAVGKYAERDAGTDTARKGLFRATATLEATFEGEGEGTDMIKGTIRDFVDDSGASRTAWHVVLVETPIDDGAFGATTVATTSGEAQGQDWRGNWNGEFYGPRTPEVVSATPVPSSVAGLFNAAFGCNEMGGCPDAADMIPAEVGFVGVSGVFGADHSENFAQ